MTDQTLSQLLAGRSSVTLGHFIENGRPIARFGLKDARSYNIKPTIDGRAGRGGGFAETWNLGNLLYHEYGSAGRLQPGITLRLSDGREYTADSLAALAADWQRESAAV